MTSPNRALSPIQVLVLEDDPQLRTLLCAVLEDEGYHVESASRGEDALQMARARPFDLVVADIRMEGMDGLEVLRQVKQELPGTGTLVISGYSTEADSIRAIRLGVGDYLKKPFELQDFVGSVSRLVAERRRDQPEQAMRKLALLALRKLSGPALPGWVETLAKAAGLSEAAAENVELAVLARQAELPLVPELEAILTRTDCPQSRVAALAPACAELAPGGPRRNLEAAIEKVYPGRFDQDTLELLRREDRPMGSERGLLALGRALETAGDRDGAQAIYRELISRESEETVAAHLGMGRLARAAGDVHATREALRRAVELAGNLGLSVAGETSLEAGLILLGMRDPQAHRWLAQAADTLEQVGRSEAAAQAHLALSHLQAQPPREEALALLLRGENAARLAPSVEWLYPLLLETHSQLPSGLTGRALGRLVREFPDALTGLLARDCLSVPARLAAVNTLLAEGVLPPLEALALDRDAAVASAAKKALAGLGKPQPEAALRVVSLGAFAVYRGDHRIDDAEWRTRKIKYLFAYLVSQRDALAGEDQLIEMFWPEDLSKGRRSLYWATSALRRCLRQGERESVVRSHGSLKLNPDIPIWHDKDELERVLAEAVRARAAQDQLRRLECARRAAALYTGPYLDGCYYDWALDVRRRLEEQVAELLFEHAEHCVMLGGPARLGEAAGFLRQVLEIDPCHQSAHLALMRLLLKQGRSEEAVRQFESCRRLLRIHLDMEPSIEMLEAHQRALLNL